jgi:RHS repeat-associated protein
MTMVDTTTTDIPAIRTFQFEAEAVGALSKSVNLFRGAVNHSQTLLTLPGRPGRKELAVNVTLLYQSNVHDVVTRRNLESPTGVLGVGWDLPLECIFVEVQGTASAATRTYYWQSAGTTTRMVRQGPTYQAPLFTSTAITPQDLQGPGISPNLQQVFAAHGLALSLKGSVTAAGGSSWTITDTDREQLFTVTPSANGFTILDGGESYQLQSYQFWRITYYPAFERWQIIKENGGTSSYGGGVQTTGQGYNTSQRNSVRWGVKWGNWLGNSSVTRGQAQYATAWYLSWVGDRWGDRVTYAYNGWPNQAADRWARDPQTGLIPAVEQRVGYGQADGLPFTKAVYVTQITDVFGRTMTLHYCDKTYTDPVSNPTGPREYQDPHKPTANNTTPNSFQDPVATKYLDHITVQSGSGTTLLSIGFAYAPLANVTGYTGSLYGDTYKRYLQSITQYTADGDAQPGLRFDYYTQPTDVYLGALKSITYPTGATATYSYQLQPLPICARKQPVGAPDTSGGWTPRVFFGPDYAVTLWYNNNAGQLSMTVYTWLGRWQAWQPPAGARIYANPLGLDIDQLQVIPGDEQFALSFPAQTTGGARRTFLYLYHKDPSQMGQWLTLDQNDQPALAFDTSSSTLSFTAGDSFVVAVQQDHTTNSYQLWRYTWDWTQRTWTVPAQPRTGSGVSNVALTAGREYYLLATYTKGQANTQMSLSYVDPLGSWHDGQPLVDPQLRVGYDSGIFFAPGAFFAAAAVETQQSPTYPQYTQAIYQWDEAYTLSKAFLKTFTQHVREGGQQTSIVPEVTNNSLVLCGENALRYDGAAWQLNQTLQIQNPAAGSQDAWYAVGDDFVLQTVPSLSVYEQPTCRLLAYDADIDVTGWGAKTASTPQPPLRYRMQDPSTANFPTAAGGDYFTSDKYLYARGQSPDWSVGEQQPLFTMPDNLNTKSILNQSPDFITYLVPNEDLIKTVTQVLILNNGEVAATEPLTGEKYWTADEKTAANGRYPAGPSAFVTYAATVALFDEAQAFTLYRFAGDSIMQNLIHYPVTALAVDDGFGQVQYTAYQFDPSAAACDSTGTVVKYYKSTTYPGSQSPQETPFGRTETYYINGYQGGTVPYAYMLDGTPEKTLTYDSANNLVASEQNTWAVYTARNSNPITKDVTPLLLYGGYAKLLSQVRVQDGVSTTTTHVFVPQGFEYPFSGQEVEAAVENYNGAGQKETHLTRKKYAYEVYPDLVGHNVLAPAAQTTQLVSVNGAIPVTTGSTATIYKPWPAGPAAPATVQVLAAGASYAWRGGTAEDFPFSSTPDPAVWLQKSQVVARSVKGLATETTDALGVPSSALYDVNPEFPIATFANASISGGELAYCGFEAYMDLAGWTVGAGANIIAGDAHTGACGLQLPGQGVGSLGTTLTPTRQGQQYLLSCWYKTGPTFQGNAQTGWTIAVTASGAQVGDAIFVPFVATQGLWSYVSHAVDLASYQPLQPGVTLSITLTATNTAATVVLLDDVCIAPFPGGITTRTYDTDHSLLLTETTLGGKTTRHLYDHFQRKLGQVGPAEQIRTLIGQFASRRGNGDQFSASDPNCAVKIQARSGGFCESFQSGDEWQRRWTASGTWQVAGGALTHPTGASATLTLAAEEFSANFALYVELTPQGAVTDALGVNLGGTGSLAWQPATTQWVLTISGQLFAPLARPAGVARQWLLIGGERSLLFYADGQLLFSQMFDHPPVSGLQLLAGVNALSLRNLALVKDPVVSVAYHDAAGRVRQTHKLLDQDSLVSQMIYDAAGRGIATTKAAPGSFGKGANVPLLAYRGSFVDVTSFLATLDTSGVMQGDVADYYRGQTEPASGLPRADDECYPYARKRYEASPLARIIETGAPGKDYAIIGPNAPNTVKYRYAGSVSGDMPDIPPDAVGQYLVETHISPPNNGSTQTISSKALKDKNGALVLRNTALTAGPDGDILGKTVTTYSPSGRQVEGYLPKYYSSVGGTGGESFVITENYDVNGRLVRRQEPNTKLGRAMYDRVGRRRFSQVNQEASAPAERYIAYWKYDALGRETESGTYPYDWNDTTEATLQALADNPNWPPATNSVQIVRQYDGDGSDPNAIGRLVQVVRSNVRNGKTITVTEQYQYDESGRIYQKSLQVTDDHGLSASSAVGYQYNNLGQVTTVTYPQGAVTGVPQVYYSYDRQGRTLQIGESAAKADSYAAYTYDAAGKVIATALGGGLMQRGASFLSPGWLGATSATAPEFTAKNAYVYWPNGSLQAVTTSFSGAGNDDQYTSTYTYDAMQRLTSAQNTAHPDRNLAVTGYDANGNLRALQIGGKEVPFSYLTGTDQLSTLQHDQFGHVQATPALQLAYEPGIGLTSEATLAASGDGVLFEYSGKGQRVLKQVVHQGQVISSQLYVHGTQALPLVEMHQDGTATAYIYGPDGLIAMKADALYFVLNDHEGSVRHVLDSTGSLVAGYEYLPFGGLARSYGANPTLMTYLYTGQEFDAETGLYNYRARLYDASLRRFYAPDPKRQFASPYIYVGDDPIMAIDPTGMYSIDTFFHDVGHFFTNTIVENVISFVVDAAFIIAGIAVLATTPFGGPASTVLGSTLLGAGIGGLTYNIAQLATHQQFSWGGWGVQLGIGAAAGLISGGFAAGSGAVVSASADTTGGLLDLSKTFGQSTFYVGGAGRIAVNTLLGGVVGNAVSGFTGELMSNAATHTPLWTGVGFATLLGGVLGAAGGLVTEGAASRLSTVPKLEGYQELSRPDWPGAEEEYAEFRYVPESRWNNTLLALPGSGFTAIDAAVNAIWDAAGWPRRF